MKDTVRFTFELSDLDDQCPWWRESMALPQDLRRALSLWHIERHPEWAVGLIPPILPFDEALDWLEMIWSGHSDVQVRYQNMIWHYICDDVQNRLLAVKGASQ